MTKHHHREQSETIHIDVQQELSSEMDLKRYSTFNRFLMLILTEYMVPWVLLEMEHELDQMFVYLKTVVDQQERIHLYLVSIPIHSSTVIDVGRSTIRCKITKLDGMATNEGF